MNAQRWSYLTIRLKPKRFMAIGVHPEDLQDELNKHGAQGWELVSVVSTRNAFHLDLIFKRAQ
jgi:Domain of unknown function (DUF4177)